MRGKLLTVAALIAILSAAAVATPAFGGPSPLAVAKKALKLATKANNNAKRAQQDADTAILAGSQTFTVRSPDISASPQDFARFDVRCPNNYVASGMGMGLGALEPVAVLPADNGYVGSYFNPSTTQAFTGSLFVICVRGSSTAQPIAKQKALGQLASSERARQKR
jgi:hypothetical protein